MKIRTLSYFADNLDHDIFFIMTNSGGFRKFHRGKQKRRGIPYFEDALNKAKRIRQMNEGRAQRVVILPEKGSW